MSRQSANGAFGMWAADSGDDDPWLDAFVTDFLTRARERKFVVPEGAFGQALDRSAQHGRQRARSRTRTTTPRSPMRSMCWRATAGR